VLGQRLPSSAASRSARPTTSAFARWRTRSTCTMRTPPSSRCSVSTTGA
jgi:hypothetical protein